MKRWQTVLSLVMLVLCITLVPTPLLAKGGGGGGGDHGGGGNRSGDGRDGFSGDQGGMREQGESRQKIQEQNQVSSQQRTQIQDCENTMQHMQVRIRAMDRLASGESLQAGELERARLSLHSEFRQLEEAHSRFAAGLNSRDRDQLGDRLRDMDHDRDRIHTCLQNLENELAQPHPEQSQLRLNIQEMEQAMERWQEHYAQFE